AGAQRRPWAVPEAAARAGLRAPGRDVRRPVLHRPGSVRVPALRGEGNGRRRADQPADVLQRDRLHPVVPPDPGQGPGLGGQPVRITFWRVAPVDYVRDRDQTPITGSGRAVLVRLPDPPP